MRSKKHSAAIMTYGDHEVIRPENKLRKALTEALRQLQDQSLDALLEAREDKILGYGRFKEITTG